MIWFIGGLVIFISALAWWYPIGEDMGKKFGLLDLRDPNIRIRWKMDRAKAALEKCMLLPPAERLAALLKANNRYRGTPFVGSSFVAAIAATGLSDTIPWIRWMWEKANQPSCAINGIHMAIESGESTEDYRVQVFQMLVDGLNDPFSGGRCPGRIPETLMLLDEQWATRILRSPEYLSPRYYFFEEVLQVFNRRGIKLGVGEIQNWLSFYQGKSLESRPGRQFIEVLKALCLHDQPLAETHLEKLINEQPSVACKAAEVLFEMRDLPSPHIGLYDLEEKMGFEGMNEVEKTAWLLDVYNYRMGCGGFSALEYNGYGERMIEMHEALLRVGAPVSAARLKEYINLYGPGGPAHSEPERYAQITAQGDRWTEAVDEICDRYSEMEDTNVLGVQYELAHENELRKMTEIRRLLAL